MTPTLLAAVGLGIAIGLFWEWIARPHAHRVSMYIWRRYSNCIEALWDSRDVW